MKMCIIKIYAIPNDLIVIVFEKNQASKRHS